VSYTPFLSVAVQSREQFHHNAGVATTSTTSACAAEDHFDVDVMEPSTIMNTMVHSENRMMDCTPSKTSTLPSQDYFDDLLIPRWRNLKDASDSGFYSMTKKPRGLTKQAD
jgi:hypothetical protein